MLNLREMNQAEHKIYTKPEFEIVELIDEDVISTSLEDKDEIDFGKLGEFEWF